MTINDHRNRWGIEQLNSWSEGVKTIKNQLGNNQNIEDIALKFSNSFDFVSSSLVGVQSVEQLNSNLKDNNFSILKEESIKNIIKINKKEFFIKKNAPRRLI